MLHFLISTNPKSTADGNVISSAGISKQMVELEEMSGNHQMELDSSSGDNDHLYQITLSNSC